MKNQHLRNRRNQSKTFFGIAFFIIASVTVTHVVGSAEAANPVGHEDHMKAASDRPFENTQPGESSVPVLLPIEDTGAVQAPTQPNPGAPSALAGKPGQPGKKEPKQPEPGYFAKFLASLGAEFKDSGGYFLKGGIVGGVAGVLIGLGGSAFAANAFSTMLGPLANIVTFGGKTGALGALGWGISGLFAGAIILGGLFLTYALIKSLVVAATK